MVGKSLRIFKHRPIPGRWLGRFVNSALVALGLLTFPGAADADRPGEASTREIIIRRPRHVLRGARDSVAFGNLNHRWRVRRLRPAYPFPFGNPELAAQLGLDRLFVLEVPEGTDTKRMAADYRSLNDVELAEPETIGTVSDLVPNDDQFFAQWNMNNTIPPPVATGGDIDATRAWMIHTGELGTVTIAIVDSGVDPHPEFAGRLVPGINTHNPEMPDLTSTVCDRADGCPGTDGEFHDCPHGTHVAGIAAAAGNNGVGVAGVTWGANIMPIRVVDSYCQSTTVNTGVGVIWAVDHGADIINMSLQFYDIDSPTLRGAVEYAAAQGVLLVAASGNNRGPNVAYPAKYASVIAVGATTNRDTWAAFSNYGPEVDISAPGDRIWSTHRSGPTMTYGNNSGTSMASPHVAGLAALLLSYNPNVSTLSLRRIIQQTADDLGEPGLDPKLGYGRINAYKALQAAFTTLVITASDPLSGSIDARQPSELDGSSPSGWNEIELTFSNEAYLEPPSAFSITTAGGTLVPPIVVQVVPITRTRIRLVLSRQIEVGTWTTITHKESNTFVQLGYLPGDVNGDGIVEAVDSGDLLAALISGVAAEAPASTDLDRSGESNLLDGLRQIDLMNGADEFEPFVGAELPDA